MGDKQTKKIYNLHTGKLEEVEIRKVKTKVEDPVNELSEREAKNQAEETKGFFSLFWSIIKIGVWTTVFLVLSFAGVQIFLAEKYEARVRVILDKNRIETNATSTVAGKIDFGDAVEDTLTTRYTMLKSEKMHSFVYIMKFGAIAEMISTSKNEFTLKKGEEKKIEFNLYIPPSAPQGVEYLGRVWIFKVPKVW